MFHVRHASSDTPVDFLDQKNVHPASEASPNAFLSSVHTSHPTAASSGEVSRKKRFSFSLLSFIPFFLRRTNRGNIQQSVPFTKVPHLPTSRKSPPGVMGNPPQGQDEVVSSVARSAVVPLDTKLNTFREPASPITPASAKSIPRTPPKEREAAVQSLRIDTPEEVDVNLVLPYKGVRLSPQQVHVSVLIFFIIEFCILLGITLVVSAKASVRMVVLADLEGILRIQEARVERQKNVLETYVQLEHKAGVIQQILDRRKDPLTLLVWFEQHVLPTVTLRGLSLDASGTVHARVITHDAVSASQQMRLFLDTPDGTPVLSDLKQEEDSVGSLHEPVFSFSASFPPQAFASHENLEKHKVPH